MLIDRLQLQIGWRETDWVKTDKYGRIKFDYILHAILSYKDEIIIYIDNQWLYTRSYAIQAASKIGLMAPQSTGSLP